jgi:methylamine utilization protein MauJ
MLRTAVGPSVGRLAAYFSAIRRTTFCLERSAEMPSFVMVSVSSGVPWPVDEHTVVFSGHQIRLVPPRRDEAGELRAYPVAAIEYQRGADREELVTVIRRFLNGLAWREQASIREVDVSYGFPIRTGTRIPGNSATPWFDAQDLPDPTDAKARLALALYREGLDLQYIHRAYSFLSLFKVLNLRFPTGRAQIAWINGNVVSLRESNAVARCADIARTEPDVGAYLYTSGRCAVAHAFARPLVDPNDIRDQQRLSRDWPVIRSLAALLVQTEWRVQAPPWQAAV